MPGFPDRKRETMAAASLILGIIAVALALLGTAPCFVWLAVIGAGFGLAAIGLGVASLLRDAKRALRQEPAVAADSRRHACTGIGLALVALLWGGFVILLLTQGSR